MQTLLGVGPRHQQHAASSRGCGERKAKGILCSCERQPGKEMQNAPLKAVSTPCGGQGWQHNPAHGHHLWPSTTRRQPGSWAHSCKLSGEAGTSAGHPNVTLEEALGGKSPSAALVLWSPCALWRVVNTLALVHWHCLATGLS